MPPRQVPLRVPKQEPVRRPCPPAPPVPRHPHESRLAQWLATAKSPRHDPLDLSHALGLRCSRQFGLIAMPNGPLGWPKLLCSMRRNEISRNGRNSQTASVDTKICAQEIESDYDRILSAAPTRRLSDKTQVFPLDAHDSISTRLTHSLEVSNLARSIGLRLAHNHHHRHALFGDLADELKVERTVPALLAAAGLAHDLGTPPFGHPGEEAIAKWCRERDIKLQDFANFDSNCQTFRLLTRFQTLNSNFGLDLTCATLAAALKYPVFCNDRSGFRKFGIFERERDIALEVWAQTGLAEGVRHPLAYVVEACDDIAYSVMDAEDIVRLGYASFKDVMDVLARSSDTKTRSVMTRTLMKCKDIQSNGSRLELDRRSMQIFRMTSISEMIRSATRTFVRHASEILKGETGSEFEIVPRSDVAELCRLLQNLGRYSGFEHRDVRRRAKKDKKHIRETMDYIWRGIVNWDSGSGCSRFDDYMYSRLPETCRRVYEGTNRSCSDKLHLLCDVVAGMTNSQLISLHDDLKDLRTSASL